MAVDRDELHAVRLATASALVTACTVGDDVIDVEDALLRAHKIVDEAWRVAMERVT